MRRWRHTPERLVRVVHRVVALALGLKHGRREGRVPEDLLSDITLRETGQGLIEVHAERARGGILAQPIHVLAQGKLGGWAVDVSTTRNAGADRPAAIH